MTKDWRKWLRFRQESIVTSENDELWISNLRKNLGFLAQKCFCHIIFFLKAIRDFICYL